MEQDKSPKSAAVSSKGTRAAQSLFEQRVCARGDRASKLWFQAHSAFLGQEMPQR
jgi:hypothetical protein